MKSGRLGGCSSPLSPSLDTPLAGVAGVSHVDKSNTPPSWCAIASINICANQKIVDMVGAEVVFAITEATN